MDANKNSDAPKQEAKKEPPDVPPQSQGNSSVNTATNQDNSSRAANNTTKPITQKYWKGYWRKWIDPLVIVTIALVVATGFLARYTFNLFKDAAEANNRNKEANQIAKKSADAAIEAVIEQKESNKRIKEFQDKSAWLDSTSLQTQINSIKQNQKDFELESRAFVYPINIEIDTVSVGGAFVIKFVIKNMGKFPARLIYQKYAGALDLPTRSPSYIMRRFYGNGQWIEQYLPAVITMDNQTTQSIVAPVNRDEKMRFSSGDFCYYLTGRINYISLGIQKKYVLKFCAKIYVNTKTKEYGSESIYFSDKEIR